MEGFDLRGRRGTISGHAVGEGGYIGAKYRKHVEGQGLTIVRSQILMGASVVGA